ncbi:MarR family transcriptional regulator [Streptomyces sp. NPDC051940]|uniref:MarR family winged helix-turn-helix transcriptional regulator n=1 Tax=Streptomyces sp. NPDC051940 TaxID=3155675 RepID=UPI0034235EB8
MSTRSPRSEPAPVPAEVVDIERALSRITHLAGRVRQHERLMAAAGVPLDRATVSVLRQLADRDPLRPSELAARLAVEPSHVTRQVQRLEQLGYVARVADPEDRRAQRIELTADGAAVVDRIREASRRGMQNALKDWSPEDLRQLAALFNRMVDDFVSSAAEAEAAD